MGFSLEFWKHHNWLPLPTLVLFLAFHYKVPPVPDQPNFPDFSSLFKIPWLFPDWKITSHFPRLSSPSGNPVLRLKVTERVHQIPY